MAEHEQSHEPVKAKKRRKGGGRYCSFGTSNNISCKNGGSTPGISLHGFPKDKRRPAWIRFMRRHRQGWQLTSSSLLCSAHFESECFTQRPDISLGPESESAKTKRWLNETAIPTIDAVETNREKPPPTEREKRQVSLV